MAELKRKELVVVTGATSGIGEATARVFSAAGYPLLLMGRRVERLHALDLPNCLCEKVDVTDGESFSAAIERAEVVHGPTGCLVNNAGVMLLGNFHSQDPAEWKRMLDVNLMGVLNGTTAVLNKMRQSQKGTIINVGSVAGRKLFPNHAVYCATKFALHALTEGLREEYARDGVRFITIAPGAVETELMDHTTSQEIKMSYTAWRENVGQILKPDDIARSIIFAFEQPAHVCIREILICPTRQEP